MPTYQYACTVCAERLEVVQRFSDDPLTECPACGGALRKVFSAVGVVFKGSGFYKNDSRKPAPSTSSSGSSGSSDTSAPAKDKPAAASSTPSSTGTDTAAAS